MSIPGKPGVPSKRLYRTLPVAFIQFRGSSAYYPDFRALSSMNGEVGHFEIPAKDSARAKAFYSRVFGWKISDSPMASGETYTSLETTEVDSNHRPKSPGAINGGLVKMRDPNTAPVITIVADDINASLELVEKNGGKTVVKRTEMGEYGAYAYFRDTEGNVMGLYQYPKM